MNTARFGFVAGVYRSMRVPRGLALTIFNKGMPLLANEVLWAVGVSALTQIFSTYNLNVVGALNIANTITNLFNVAFISMGSAVAVMVGQALGAGDMQRAKEYSWKLIFFSVCTCIIIGAVLVAVAPVIPRIYNTTEDVRKLSAHFMIVSAFICRFLPYHTVLILPYVREARRLSLLFLTVHIHGA